MEARRTAIKRCHPAFFMNDAGGCLPASARNRPGFPRALSLGGRPPETRGGTARSAPARHACQRRCRVRQGRRVRRSRSSRRSITASPGAGGRPVRAEQGPATALSRMSGCVGRRCVRDACTPRLPPRARQPRPRSGPAAGPAGRRPDAPRPSPAPPRRSPRISEPSAEVSSVATPALRTASYGSAGPAWAKRPLPASGKTANRDRHAVPRRSRLVARPAASARPAGPRTPGRRIAGEAREGGATRPSGPEPRGVEVVEDDARLGHPEQGVPHAAPPASPAAPRARRAGPSPRRCRPPRRRPSRRASRCAVRMSRRERERPPSTAQRAAVGPARRPLEPADHRQRRALGRAGHRAAGVQRREHVERGHPGAARPRRRSPSASRRAARRSGARRAPRRCAAGTRA